MRMHRYLLIHFSDAECCAGQEHQALHAGINMASGRRRGAKQETRLRQKTRDKNASLSAGEVIREMTGRRIGE